ncbi:MAG: hypothetical protein MSH60_05515, partial [Ruminococcus sp.]|nr:hypothetical protein [Ruminococcus sp.]
MKIFRRIAALFTAAIMCFLMCVPIGAYLGAGAYVSGYSIDYIYWNGRIEKDTYFDITITSYIPIENIVDTTTTTDYSIIESYFSFARADNTESFIIDDNFRTGSSEKKVKNDSFLEVKTTFKNVYYTGKGKTFSYKLFFNSNSSGTSINLTTDIIECIEYVDPEQKDPNVPTYTLASGQTFTAAAGSETVIKPTLRNLTSGFATAASATLSSSDSNVTVLTTEAQSINSSAYITAFSPAFTIFVPQTTPAGIYQLSLSVTSYDINGTAHTQEPITIPINVTNDLNASGLKIDNYKV